MNYSSITLTRRISMAAVNYTVKLTNIVNDKYTTEGCLDTSVRNGLSNQRTVEMLSVVGKVIGRKKDGDVFNADVPYVEELDFLV